MEMAPDHAKLLHYTRATLHKLKLQQESNREINNLVSHVPVLSFAPSPFWLYHSKCSR